MVRRIAKDRVGLHPRRRKRQTRAVPDAAQTSNRAATLTRCKAPPKFGTGKLGRQIVHIDSVLTKQGQHVLRRARPSGADEMLTYSGIAMDLAAHRVIRNGRNIHLGPTEFRLLRFFMERPGRVFTREQLLDGVWGRDLYVELRTVDVHIRRLRKAINADGERDPIRTVRSAGYALDDQPDRG